jgi:hypothetical protein
MALTAAAAVAMVAALLCPCHCCSCSASMCAHHQHPSGLHPGRRCVSAGCSSRQAVQLQQQELEGKLQLLLLLLQDQVALRPLLAAGRVATAGVAAAWCLSVRQTRCWHQTRWLSSTSPRCTQHHGSCCRQLALLLPALLLLPLSRVRQQLQHQIRLSTEGLL